MIFVFHNADLLTFDRGDIRIGFGHGHHTEALICDSEKAVSVVDVDLTEGVHQFLVLHVFPEGLDIRIDTGSIKYTELGYVADLGRRGSRDERNISVLHGFHQLQVSSQSAVSVDLDLHFSVGELAHIVRKSPCKDVRHGLSGTAGGQRPGKMLFIISAADKAVNDRGDDDRNDYQLADSLSAHISHPLIPAPG